MLDENEDVVRHRYGPTGAAEYCHEDASLFLNPIQSILKELHYKTTLRGLKSYRVDFTIA